MSITRLIVPSGATRSSSPWFESIGYSVLPTAGLVWLEGRPVTTVVTTPSGLTFEIRPPSTGSFVLPVYGAAPPLACGHTPTVEFVPPRPPSATYRFPSGPNVRPLGLLKP